GPYHLAGVSFGGVLAYEAAQQLRAAGEEVAVVAIMDVAVPATLGRAPSRWLASNVSRVVRWATAKVLGRMHTGHGRNGHAGLQHVPAYEIDDHSELNKLRMPYYRAAWQDYQRHLRAYSGRVVVFRAVDREEPAQAEGPPDCGWSAFVPRRDLHCYDVPGDHLGILRQPSVAVLARALRGHLDQRPRSGGKESQ
ncbi:MAG TPA: thioesterase domain-containing protein, partial [Candidatus Limnocylindrales bacterium]|nr:thioesterase domain-containing protein [Candidatus Limnocylindrales bacterium]